MEKQKNYKKFIILKLTTLLGLGYIRGGGTLASLLGVGIFLLIKNNLSFFAFTLLVIILSLSLTTRAEEIIGKKDPKEVVIDDLSGQLLSLLFIPKKIPFIILAFFIFRLFDLLKIPPADILEKKKGSAGIVGDDLIAGLYTNVLLQAVRFILKISS